MSDTPIISKTEMAALLGRPLKTVEETNFELYLSIAVLRLNDLLCIKLQDMKDLPADLKLLIARCFATITEEQSAGADNGVKSKKVEDFSITYNDAVDSPMVAFVKTNTAILDKYSMCQGPIRSGRVCCGHCL